MAFKSKLETPLRVPPSPFERNILLLDASEPRQFARAAAMRAAGATVQCVSTVAAARAAWKPGSHQLVMIDLDGAGAPFREFYEYARALSTKQSFAFYVPYPPYLAPTPNGHGTSAVRRAADGGKPATPRPQRSLSSAVTRIAAARTNARARRDTSEARSASFADAVKAAEREAENKS